VDDEERLSSIVTIVVVLGVLYLWVRAWGKVTERIATPFVSVTHDAISKVIRRAEEITKEASKGVES
jgi:hypothetical protein